MSYEPFYSFEWGRAAKSGSGFGISAAGMKRLLGDGRVVSFMMEVHLSEAFAEGRNHFKLVAEGNAAFDLIGFGKFEGNWDVRCITKHGVYFTSAGQVGGSRKFSEKGYQKKRAALTGFILADITEFPKVDCYLVRKDVVEDWRDEGRIGKKTKVTAKAIRKLLSED
jgi:hypothetical protein